MSRKPPSAAAAISTTLRAGSGNPIGKVEKEDIDPSGIDDVEAIVDRSAPKLVDLDARLRS